MQHFCIENEKTNGKKMTGMGMGNSWAIIAYKWLDGAYGAKHTNKKYIYTYIQEDEVNTTNWRNDFFFFRCM